MRKLFSKIISVFLVSVFILVGCGPADENGDLNGNNETGDTVETQEMTFEDYKEAVANSYASSAVGYTKTFKSVDEEGVERIVTSEDKFIYDDANKVVEHSSITIGRMRPSADAEYVEEFKENVYYTNGVVYVHSEFGTLETNFKFHVPYELYNLVVGMGNNLKEMISDFKDITPIDFAAIESENDYFEFSFKIVANGDVEYEEHSDLPLDNPVGQGPIGEGEGPIGGGELPVEPGGDVPGGEQPDLNVYNLINVSFDSNYNLVSFRSTISFGIVVMEVSLDNIIYNEDVAIIDYPANFDDYSIGELPSGEAHGA